MDDEKLEREAVKIIFSAPSKAAAEEEVVRSEPEGPEVPFVCPFCNDSYLVSKKLAGKKINCRSCHEACRVDAKKPKARRWALDVKSFWLGVAVGALLTTAALAALKIMRLI